jgi:hypothetical protein
MFANTHSSLGVEVFLIHITVSASITFFVRSRHDISRCGLATSKEAHEPWHAKGGAHHRPLWRNERQRILVGDTVLRPWRQPQSVRHAASNFGLAQTAPVLKPGRIDKIGASTAVYIIAATVAVTTR